MINVTLCLTVLFPPRIIHLNLVEPIHRGVYRNLVIQGSLR